jgi:hypothetical protein
MRCLLQGKTLAVVEAAENVGGSKKIVKARTDS